MTYVYYFRYCRDVGIYLQPLPNNGNMIYWVFIARSFIYHFEWKSKHATRNGLSFDWHQRVPNTDRIVYPCHGVSLYRNQDKMISLQWRHNGHDSVSNHQPHECLFSRLFRRRSNKTSKLRVTGFCAGNSPGTGEFSAQMASNAENVSIWWRHHGIAIARTERMAYQRYSILC